MLIEMREDSNSGDLSVRLSFGTMMGTGPDAGKVRPHLLITDATSGRSIEIQLTAEQLTEMLSGSAAMVTADKVRGFRGLGQWGKYVKTMTISVDTKAGDYTFRANPRKLPHVEQAMLEMETNGWRCDSPRWGNGGKWVIVGRRYEVAP